MQFHIKPQTKSCSRKPPRAITATSGKSTAGLVAALVAAEKTELAAAVKAGDLTQAQADRITTGLQARVAAMVNGTRPAHDGPGDHHGPNGFRPAAAGTHI